MRCPACGAIIKKRSIKCPECGAFRNKSWVDPEQVLSRQPAPAQNPVKSKPANGNSSPSLIAFPTANRSTVPQWRKELGERVREVQERRAREAAVEESPAANDAEQPVPQLELLPQPEMPSVNPLVAAALQRIERAHARPQYSGNVAVATAQHYATEPELDVAVAIPLVEFSRPNLLEEEMTVNEMAPPLEKVHNLAVVPPSPAVVEVPKPPKPKRLIRDDNDPALNYLDSLPTTVGIDVARNQSAPIFSRVVSGFIDLFVTCALATPVLALVELNQLDWLQPRTIAFAGGFFVVAAFLYLTISTALTGRTVGMRLLSLRVVDARTGLIPTGAQSASRAIVYILSLASVGIVLMYTFIDRERQSAHDRFSRTAVVRM